jgi:hypothetical protein
MSALIKSQQSGDGGEELDLPFTLRLLSSNNLFSPPLDDAPPLPDSPEAARESFHRFYDFKVRYIYNCSVLQLNLLFSAGRARRCRMTRVGPR